MPVDHKGLHVATRAAHAKPVSPHRVRKIVLIILLALVVCIGISAAAFVHQVDQSLGFDDTTSATDVKEVLTPAPADRPFYVLLLGSDSRSAGDTSAKTGVSTGSSYSDVMMLVRVDTVNKKISLLSIPRDTRWYDADSGKVKKINAAYLDGPARSVQTVEQLTGVTISHYVQVNIQGFTELVDALGGITLDVPTTVTYKDYVSGQTITVNKGEQKLSGAEATIVARARHEYGDNQEAMRQSMNRQIVGALITAFREQPFYKMPELVVKAANCFDTDMTTSNFLPLAAEFLQGNLTLYSGSGPSKGGVYVADNQWYCYTDTPGWQEVIDAFTAGEDMSKLAYETPEESIEQADGDTSADTVTDPATTTYLAGTLK